MGNLSDRRSPRLPVWPEPSERPRILVEHADIGMGFALVDFLESEGADVAVCGGPDALKRHRCPLVFGEDCDLATGADLVVHGLNPDRPEHAEVLRALQAKHPDTPVIVEVPKPSAERHPGLLADCFVVPLPATRVSLREAVQRALAPE